VKYDLNIDSPDSALYDYCICGAGVAGITVARALAKAGKKVALLEGGGLEYSEESQKLYNGKNVGLPYSGERGCRIRYFGGTSNAWSGRCMMFQPADFIERDYFEFPGWPIKKDELDVYIDEAKEILDVKENIEQQYVKLPNFYTAWAGISPPTRFGKKYLSELTESDKIDLYLNANLTDIVLSESLKSVQEIEIKNFNGDTYSFKGKQIVLAMGAIENARLLLNADSQIKTGVGNHSDLVGRCFMEHLNVDLGRFVTDLTNKIWQSGRLELYPNEKIVLEKRIGTSVIAFATNVQPRLFGRLKDIKKFTRDNICGSDTLTEMARKFKHFNCPGDGLISTLTEQAPNRNSRVKLSDEKDSFGLRKIILDWQINKQDVHTIKTLAYEVAKELAEQDIARVQIPDYLLSDDGEFHVGGHCHHMGTTRMASSENYGVVDENCKVFGVDNLYIAGSSVFSTSGGVNPTMPIVQLALRLARHLSA